MRPSTLLRLAFTGGRADTFRVVFTVGSAVLGVLALLTAATVAAIPEFGPARGGSDTWSVQYASPLLQEPGLRPGVVTALLLLALPVLALAGQSIRIGSPARDRRLAALRLAGATPRQTVLVAAAETALAALVGSLLGLGGYLVGRELLDGPNRQGQLALPTDVLPSPPVLVGIVLLVPVLAGLVGVLLLRRVIVTPFGVVRRTRERTPRIWPGVIMIAGVFALVTIRPLGGWLSRSSQGSPTVLSALIVATAMLAALGVVAGTGWIARTTGLLLHRYGRRPAMLVAGRQLLADPWSTSRTSAALLAGVLVGAGALGVRAVMAADLVRQGGFPDDNSFYFDTFDLVDLAVAVALVLAAAGIMVALIEGIVTRRRGYAALVATGVPRRTLGEAVAWQTLAPLVPAVAIALTVGASLIFAFFGTADEGGPVAFARVPVPVGDLAILGGGTFAIMAAVVGVGLIFLRMSADPEELRTS